MRGITLSARKGVFFALAFMVAEVGAASAHAQNTRLYVNREAEETGTTINFYVHKAIRTDNVYYAANHSHSISRGDPRLLREMGVKAIESRTGCAVDPDTVVLTVFRSEMFGIYGSRVDGEVHC